ncbi:MAG TPA: methyltransferase domain-containing protein [Polyangiaceae bacterium]
MAAWNAEVYARVSAPQLEWGKRVLARLELAGDETVLDAGCGTGRLTELLAERLPRGHIVALDASSAMLVKAREVLARFGDRVTFVQADAARFTLPSPVDVVFSTATFHWVLDHDALFERLHACLVAGGRLVAQWGGGDNLRRIRSRGATLRASTPFAAHFAGFAEPWNYATAEQTQARLQHHGFVEVKAWLEEAPYRFADAPSFREFVAHVVLRDDLACLRDEAARERFLDAIVEPAARDDPPFVLDYRRLNADARRG